MSNWENALQVSKNIFTDNLRKGDAAAEVERRSLNVMQPSSAVQKHTQGVEDNRPIHSPLTKVACPEQSFPFASTGEDALVVDDANVSGAMRRCLETGTPATGLSTFLA